MATQIMADKMGMPAILVRPIEIMGKPRHDIVAPARGGVIPKDDMPPGKEAEEIAVQAV